MVCSHFVTGRCRANEAVNVVRGRSLKGRILSVEMISTLPHSGRVVAKLPGCCVFVRELKESYGFSRASDKIWVGVVRGWLSWARMIRRLADI